MARSVGVRRKARRSSSFESDCWESYRVVLSRLVMHVPQHVSLVFMGQLLPSALFPTRDNQREILHY